MHFPFMETALPSEHLIFGKGTTFLFMKTENWIFLLKMSLFYFKAIWQVINLASKQSKFLKVLFPKKLVWGMFL